ncbi:MAG: RNA polymerase sigma factor [Stappiaceae bacterium]
MNCIDQESVLIERAKSGDRSAFAALLETQYSRIFRCAYKWLGNREDAEDVAQDVSVKLAKKIADFRGDSALSSWIYRVTLNAVRDFERQRAGRNLGLGKYFQFMQVVGEEQVQSDDAELDDLWFSVRKLPPKQRDAVLLVYGEECTHQTAAGIMNCSEKTVSWHLHAARKKLRHILKEEGHV